MLFDFYHVESIHSSIGYKSFFMLDPLNVIVASAFLFYLFLPSGCRYFIQKCNIILLILVSFSYRSVFHWLFVDDIFVQKSFHFVK